MGEAKLHAKLEGDVIGVSQEAVMELAVPLARDIDSFCVDGGHLANVVMSALALVMARAVVTYGELDLDEQMRRIDVSIRSSVELMREAPEFRRMGNDS